jgi:hypothetical protein
MKILISNSCVSSTDYILEEIVEWKKSWVQYKREELRRWKKNANRKGKTGMNDWYRWRYFAKNVFSIWFYFHLLDLL